MENEIITYYNLTQCADGDTNKRFVYFRSTDIEQKNYTRLLWGVPDEWFYFLSLGKWIKVVDISSNGKGKMEKIFIPVLNDLLNVYLFHGIPVHQKFQHHFKMAKRALDADGFLYAKIKYWEDKITIPIEILTETIHVDKEPNPLETKNEDVV